MSPNASSCAQCTVRPNNVEKSEFGAEKVLSQGHAVKLMAHAPKSPKPSEGFRQSIFKGQVGGGVTGYVIISCTIL